MPGDVPTGKKVKKKRKKLQIVANLQHCGYAIIHRAAKDMGWRVAERGESWDFGWSDNNQLLREMSKMFSHPRTLQPVQRINHLPNNKHLYRKDTLANNMMNLRAELPEAFCFAPVSWTLPRDRKKMEAALAVDRAAVEAATKAELEPEPELQSTQDGLPVGGLASAGKQKIYIVKPALGLQGAGIQLTTEPDKATMVTEGAKGVVQHYVDPPMLIDGFKFDLRLYVFVLSVDPLKIYLYDDGLARLCTTEYQAPTAKNLHKSKMHLTNYSLNKKSKHFVKGADGTKRSLGAAFDYLAERGHDVDQIWTNVVDLCVKTLLAVQPQLVSAYKRYVPANSVLSTPTCSVFEIFGFDIMLDAGGAPWLIEINHAPSFRGSSKQDTACKKGVIQGAFEMLGVTEKRKRLLTQRVRKQWSAYMWDQARVKSKEKQTPVAAVTAAMTLAERDRRAWMKGSPAKQKALSVPRTTKSPARTLPPLSRSSTPGSSSNRLSRDEFAAADPWRIVSRDRLRAASGAGFGAGAAARQPLSSFSVHKRANLRSGGSAKPMSLASVVRAPSADGDPSDEYRRNAPLHDDEDDDDENAFASDDEEEEEGLDVEDEDGEEVLEGDINDDRLMNCGPFAVVQSLNNVETGGGMQLPATAEAGESPATLHSPTSNSSRQCSDGEAAARTDSSTDLCPNGTSKTGSSTRGPESRANSEYGGEPAVRTAYQYAAPTAGGPHGYVRIYSELSQNDRERYSDVIAAAARVFARTKDTVDADCSDHEEEQAEEEAAAAAEAEAARSAGDGDYEEYDEDGVDSSELGSESSGLAGVAGLSSSLDHVWNAASTIVSSQTLRSSSGGEQLSFGRKMPSKTRPLAGRD